MKKKNLLILTTIFSVLLLAGCSTQNVLNTAENWNDLEIENINGENMRDWVMRGNNWVMKGNIGSGERQEFPPEFLWTWNRPEMPWGRPMWDWEIGKDWMISGWMMSGNMINPQPQRPENRE